MTGFPYYPGTKAVVYNADCLELLRTLPDASIDAVVTDPPYGLSKEPDMAEVMRHWLAGDDYTHHGAGFMGKSWDSFVPGPSVWRECFRVLKPGGHLLSFAGSRTQDLMGLSIRLAGFEIRDSIAWLHGQGFPKANSQLKPAFEPIVVARKPLAGTVAANVLEHGTGALNIDACRTGAGEDRTSGGATGKRVSADEGYMGSWADAVDGRERPTGGRWPTNVVLDESQAAELDQQTDVTKSAGGSRGQGGGRGAYGVIAAQPDVQPGFGDTGGASRFFPVFKYQAKAPAKERPSYVKDGAGSGRVTGLGGKVRQCNVCETRAIESGAGEPSCGHGDYRWEEPTTNSTSKVAHPTVKPLELMRWLVRLVTPPGGVVLEPFAGSGTTVEAALLEGFHCVAIEREADYLPLIFERIQRATPGLGEQVS